MEKEYKPIPGFEKYGITIDGEIKNLRTGHVKTLCLNQSKQYYVVNLSNAENKNCRPLVHRLVALTYLPNPNNLPCVNHKDENKLNNNVNNLEWCSTSYNNTYNNKHLKIAKQLEGRTFSTRVDDAKKKPVAKIDPVTNIVLATYESITAAGKDLGGVSTRCISQVANHEKYRHTAYGFKWEWV